MGSADELVSHLHSAHSCELTTLTRPSPHLLAGSSCGVGVFRDPVSASQAALDSNGAYNLNGLSGLCKTPLLDSRFVLAVLYLIISIYLNV